jgi:hypothetical protein
MNTSELWFLAIGEQLLVVGYMVIVLCVYVMGKQDQILKAEAGFISIVINFSIIVLIVILKLVGVHRVRLH